MCMNSSTLATRVLVVFGVLGVCGGGLGGPVQSAQPGVGRE